MKKIYYYITLLLYITISCNDSFLERLPETTISQDAFFKTVKDLELYTNTYYEYIDAKYWDEVSDNTAIFADASETLNLLRGNITPATVGGWNNWNQLRKFNFFLENIVDVSGSDTDINHYIGLTRLMRARWYYNMIKRYNDVPWYSTTLKDTDEDLLYKSRDSREAVVDSIIADLDFAVKYMHEDMGNKTVMSKWYALACKARICIHEGTFRKYHDELKLQPTADDFLKKAVDASLAIMNSDLFYIDKTGDKSHAYENLFINYDLSKSPEIILFKNYDQDENIKHPASAAVFDFVSSLSRDLMESYQVLTEEGKAIPYSSIENHDKKSFVKVFENRDPRLKQTFMYPGYIKPNQNKPYKPNLNLGGYPQIKFVPRTSDQVSWNSNYTDLPVSRLGEIYLIYAEAKAELGSLTQDDLDRTVNVIRNRVDMPPTIIGDINPDLNLQKQYPNVNGNNRDVILEIRRERRVELACEGFRADDLMRWKAGHLLGKSQQGVYIDRLGLHDFTGDGVPDIGLYKNEESNPISESERDKYAFYYLSNSDGSPTSIYLSKENSGHIMSTGDRDGVREFKDPQYYYYPLPQEQRLINPNLEETIFW